MKFKFKSIVIDFKLPARQLTGRFTSTGKRAAKSKLPTSASMSTWAAMLTLTLPAPPFTEPVLLATRVGSPVIRWLLTPPNPRWPRATLLLATKQEIFSCTPMCKWSTCYSHLWSVCAHIYAISKCSFLDDLLKLFFCFKETMGLNLEAPSTRRWVTSWRLRWTWPGPPAATAHALALPPSTSWTRTPPSAWVAAESFGGNGMVMVLANWLLVFLSSG